MPPPAAYPSAPPPQVLPPPLMGGVSCRTCGLVNPPGRSFCQRCGQELDPAVGTVAGAPRPVASASGGGGRRLVAAGLGLIVVAAVVGGALVFGGILGGPAPTATPRTAIGSASPVPATAQATDGPTTDATDGPTRRPTARPTRRPTIAPTDEPVTDPTLVPTDGPAPTVGGPTPAPAGTFECDQSAAIQDPLSEGWRIQGVNWQNTGPTDRVKVTLNRFQPLAGEATQAIVHILPVNEVADTLKVVAPSAGRSAVALGLWQGVRLTWALDRELSLPKVRWVSMGKDDNGFAWLVLGVRGEACYSIDVPAWSSGEPVDTSTIEVLLDVQH